MVDEWPNFHERILQFEQQGLVTRTFRRLDPERQRAVVDAIMAESAEKGPTYLNIKQVAQKAGLSVGSLYQYFGNRDKLIAFAVALSTAYLTDAFSLFRPYLTAMPFREALVTYMSYGLEWSQSQIGFIQFFGRAAYQGDANFTESVVRPVATSMRALIRDLLVAASERGELRPDIDLDATVRVVNALMIAVGDSQLFPYLNQYLQVTDEAMPPQRVFEALAELIMAGISSPDPSSQEG